MRRKYVLALCLAALVLPAAQAATSSQEDRFRAMDARIQALEAESQKLKQQAAQALAEAQAAKAELERMKAAQAEQAATVAATPSEDAVAAVSAPSQPATGASGNAFNPAISVILNGVYQHHSFNPDDYIRSGFPLVGAGRPGPQGLSLGESELALSANIDDKFYGQLVTTLEDDNGETHANIEEAYIETTALPAGLNLRAGRFFSNIGYLNSHHTHTDNFTDRPLAYQAFLGNQYGDDGVQLRWLAPLDFYLELGGELLRGEDYPSGGATHGGVGAKTLFVHAGGDVGNESSWLGGLSMLKTNVANGDDGFNGDNTLYLADLTWKWAPNGNTKDGGVTLRSEYFYEDRDGSFVDPTDPALDQPWVGHRRGAYLEGVWRINRTWDAGYRYDKLWADDSGPYASTYNPLRHSAMLTWRNSEFSLVRLQLSHDEPRQDQTDNAVYLQYQVSLGAHGAHKF